MLLTAFIDTTGKKAYIDDGFNWDDLGSNAPLKLEATVSAGYANITGINNLVNFGYMVGGFNSIRNELINLIPQWTTFSDADKKLLIKNYVYPTTATTAELDALYTPAERDNFKLGIMENINSDNKSFFSTIRSNVSGSIKFFIVKVNDLGTVDTGTEILSNTIL
ncbi:MAG: hypothetical protein FD136_2032 [Chitinophagaceae bacterium]|nr:MAG: hypothetical protein FD136_2032 [Chitinophagaceae bacterium]